MAISRERITFRPEDAGDAAFLFRLYASTREDELAQVPWPAEQKAAFLRQQFEAQTIHYKKNYSDADYAVILLDGRPIGRLYRHENGDDLRIMDIALLPEARGQGIGEMLLREILDGAAARGHVVSIHVEQFNPALHLYERLGFVKAGEYGVYYLMEWRRAT